MVSAQSLPAFSGYGIELEYMIVDRERLSVLPIADRLLHRLAGRDVAEVQRRRATWSNEIVLHQIELKNTEPEPAIELLSSLFQREIRYINEQLACCGARLMPSAMHPWMNPDLDMSAGKAMAQGIRTRRAYWTAADAVPTMLETLFVASSTAGD